MRLKEFKKIYLFTSLLSVLVFIVFQSIKSYISPQPARKENHKLEVSHVGFLKVHKAGSTTIQNMITRYCLKKGLTAMLPDERSHLSLNVPNPRLWRLQPLPKNHSFDVLMHHSVFSAVGYRAYLPKDTIYIACVREPFSQFMSAFYYFRDLYSEAILINITGSNPHHIYLQNPSEYDKGLWSKTHNYMTRDFGYPPAFNGNSTLFRKYLTRLDKFFHLVIVLEKFDESLMLLKRLLNWPLKSFLYLQSNSYKKSSNITIDVNDKHYHKQWSKMDYILYEFFLEKLEEKLAVQPTDFWKEVTYYKRVIANVTSFCKASHSNSSVVFPESEFSDKFEVKSSDCGMMKIRELYYFKILTKERKENLLKYGEESDFFQEKLKSMQWTESLQLDF